MLGTSALELKKILNSLGYIIKKNDEDIKKIIWYVDFKKTRKLYTQKKSYEDVNYSNKNAIFKNTDVKKLKDILSDK